MPAMGGSYKYGSGSGIGGGIGSLNSGPYNFSALPKYGGSGISGGIGTLGSGVSNGDDAFGGRNKF
jgi:hypothetical protein